MFHDMSFDHWCFTEQMLEKVNTPANFRTLLLKEIQHFQQMHQKVYQFAMCRGEAFATTLFSLQCFTSVLRKPGTMNEYYARQYYYECLHRGWTSCTTILSTWPTFQSSHPRLDYIRPILTSTCLANPALRDELRKPEYTNMLRVYAAECRVNLSAPQYIIRTFKKGVTTMMRRHFVHLLGFWCLRVRTKIRQWRQTHTFQPLSAFVPNTDPIDVLVQRNPRLVPNATEEFLRAIQEKTKLDQNILEVPKLQQWLIHCPNALLPFAKLCIQNYELNWYYVIVKIAEIIPLIANEGLLLMYLNFLHKAPIYNYVYETGDRYDDLLHKILKSYLNNPDLPFTDASVLSCIKLHRKICWTPKLFRQFVETYHVRRRLCKPTIANAIVERYANRDMCLRLSVTYTKDDISMLLWQSSAMQIMYAEMIKTATWIRMQFLRSVCREWKKRSALRKEALTTYRHCWLTVAARWRWVRDHKMCPVCMETGHSLVPLHDEKRHAICRECLRNVQLSGNRCPMCRCDLSIHTPSCASSVSYTSDYEDPNYDDDQWYHYD